MTTCHHFLLGGSTSIQDFGSLSMPPFPVNLVKDLSNLGDSCYTWTSTTILWSGERHRSRKPSVRITGTKMSIKLPSQMAARSHQSVVVLLQMPGQRATNSINCHVLPSCATAPSGHAPQHTSGPWAAALRSLSSNILKTQELLPGRSPGTLCSILSQIPWALLLLPASWYSPA